MDNQEREMLNQLKNAKGLLQSGLVGIIESEQLSSLISLSEEFIAQKGVYDWRTVTVVRSLTYFWTDCSRKYRETVSSPKFNEPISKGHVPGY